jgi:hypothetical protein
MAKRKNIPKVDSSAREAPIPAYRFDTGNAICELDRIIAAVNLVHDALEPSGPRPDAVAAWLTLELVREKMGDLRNSMEDAEQVEEVANG